MKVMKLPYLEMQLSLETPDTALCVVMVSCSVIKSYIQLCYYYAALFFLELNGFDSRNFMNNNFLIWIRSD